MWRCSEDIGLNVANLEGKRGLLVKQVKVFFSQIDTMFLFRPHTLLEEDSLYH